MHYSTLKILMVSCFLAVISVFSQERAIVQSVDIQGNRFLSRSKILSVMDIRVNQPLPFHWPELFIEALYASYHASGYYLMKADSISVNYTNDSSRVDLLLQIDEGNRFSVQTINLTASKPALEKELQNQFSIEQGDVFYDRQLTADIDNILDFLQNRGYPLAQVRIDSIAVNPPHVSLKIDVDTGPEIYLSAIQFRGNQYTQSLYLQRETRLNAGQLFQLKRLNQARDYLSRLSIFKQVDDPEIIFYGNKAVVTYPVEEGNASIMDGVLGYIPPKSTEKQGTVTGRLQFEFRNILGTGRFLEAYWEKKDKYTQAMRFRYKEPWLLGYPVHAGFQFTQQIRDTTYLEREWRIPVSYAPFTSLELSFEGGQRSVLPDSLGSLIYHVPRSQMWFFSLRARYNTFDDLLNPAKGIAYHTLFTLGSKQHLAPGFLIDEFNLKKRVEDRRIEVDVEMVYSILKSQVLYLGLHGAEVKSEGSFIPISDQIRLGGTTSLRGYEEDFFRGTLVSWLNTEYRYLIGRQSRAFVFFDAGYFQRKDPERWIRETRFGYGFGLRLETRLGLLGIDYGLGEGDAPLQGKIHIGMINRF